MAAQGLILVSNLVLTPFIVHDLGVEAFGLWVLIGSIASLTGLLDLGMSAALIKYVAEHEAAGDRAGGARMVAAALWLYTVLGIAGAAALTGLAFVLPDLLNIAADDRGTATLLTIGLAIGLVIGLPSIAPMAVLRGLQRHPTANAIRSATAMLNVLLTIAVLVADLGVLGLAGAALVTSILNLALLALVLARTAPEYRIRPGARDVARLKRLARFSAPIAIIQLAGRLQLKVDAIVIGSALPVRLVTPYGLAQRLAEGTRTVTDQFTRILLPLATEVGVARSAADSRALLLTATRLTLLLALAVATPLILIGGEVLGVWVGDEFRPYGDVVALLAISSVIDISSYPGAATLQSMERHKPIAWMSLASGVVNLLLSIALVGPLGVRGVAIGTCAATAAEVMLFVLPYVARVADVPARAAWREVGWRLAPAVLTYAALLEVTSRLLPVTSLLRLAAVVIVSACGYVLAYAWLGATEYERRSCRLLLVCVARARTA